MERSPVLRTKALAGDCSQGPSLAGLSLASFEEIQMSTWPDVRRATRREGRRREVLRRDLVHSGLAMSWSSGLKDRFDYI